MRAMRPRWSLFVSFVVALATLSIAAAASAADVVLEVPAFTMRHVGFDVAVRGAALEPESLRLTVDGVEHPLTVGEEGVVVAVGIVVERAGRADLALSRGDVELDRRGVRPIPAWCSVLPPLLAIVAALLTRNVVPALFLGIWFGAFMLNGMSLTGAFVGLLDVFQVFVLQALADADHAAIILFSLMIGGMVGIITANGGMRGVVGIMRRFTKTPRTGQVSTGVLGLLVFFDDYANLLVVGSTMRSVTDRLRVSREKLAYIVDSTAAPVACIAFVTTWVGFQVGLVGDAVATIDGYDESGYSVFLNSIVYSFYPWLALLFVFLVAVSGRDFGPMRAAEERARTTGRLWEPLARIDVDDEHANMGEDQPPRALNAVLPVLVLVIGVIVGLFVTGSDGTGTRSVRDVIGAADSYKALMWASLLAALVAAVLTLAQRLMTLRDTVDAWYKGGRAMGFAMVILIMAWSLSAVAEQVHTADFLLSTLGKTLPSGILPAIVFVLAAAVAFATGSSWGTMGILIPLVLPLAWAVISRDGADPQASLPIMYSATACVLAGAVWGDHCSPISDTTVLSSMACGCDHIDHVRTQMPYAMVVGMVGLAVGTIPTGFGVPWWLAMPLAFATLVVVHRFVTEPAPRGPAPGAAPHGCDIPEGSRAGARSPTDP